MDTDHEQIDVAVAAAIGNTWSDAMLVVAVVVFPWNDFFLDVFWVPLYSL